MKPEEFIRLQRALTSVIERLEAIKEVINKQTEAISSAEETRKDEKASRQPIKTIIAFDDQTIRNTQTESDRQYRVQNSIRWAAWLAFSAAVIYAGIAGLQWTEMIGATDAAVDAVHEARLSRQQSIQAFNAMVSQFRRDQRAWLIPEFGDTNIDPAGYTSQAAKIGNGGKTPASHVHYEFMIVPTPINETVRFSYPPWKYSADAPVMFPGQSFNFGFRVTRGSSADPRHAEPMPIDMEKYAHGEIVLLMYGFITYDDAFGGNHFVHICAPHRRANTMIFSTTASKTCVAYNEIDKIDER